MPVGIQQIKATQKFHAYYHPDGVRTLIGIYDTEKEAINARNAVNEARADDVVRERRIKRNKPRINRINLILAVSFGNTQAEIADMIGEYFQILSKDLIILQKIGYLSVESIAKGHYNQPHNHYTRIKDVFDMSDLDKLLEAVLWQKSRKKVSGTGRKFGEKPPVATIPGARVYGLSHPDLVDKYIDQITHSRSEYKSPKNYANGNSMSMF